ncbi:MAG TPA: dihydrofolate reductase [Puia sp.]|nr:dihydrofolate reductase [Puia sp.]
MIISLIAAASTNNVIGKDNKLLWHLPNDMKFFRNTTWGMPVVMGRKTYDALAGEPLPGRFNFVITRNRDWDPHKNVRKTAPGGNIVRFPEKANVCRPSEDLLRHGPPRAEPSQGSVPDNEPPARSEKVKVVSSLESAIEGARETDAKEVFVIGGGEIYKQSLSIAHKIYLTRVHTVVEGDAFFPVIDENLWQLTSSLDFPTDEKHAYAYSFQLWERKKIS